MTRFLRYAPLFALLAACVIEEVKDDTDDSATSDTAGTDDTGSANCTAQVDVSNGGAAIAGEYILVFDVADVPGAADDLSNVRVLDNNGDERPRYIPSASGGAGEVHVSVLDLPAGDSVLTLDACGSDAQPNDARNLYPLYETFDSAVPSNVACENIEGSETCSFEHATDGGDGYLHGSLRSSCFTDPYNGSRVALRDSIDLDPGDWRAVAYARMEGELYDYCSGSGGVSVIADIGDVTGWSDPGRSILALCSSTNCETCEQPDWAVAEGTPVTIGESGSVAFGALLYAGDCSQGDIELSWVRVERVVDPAPTATQAAR